MITVRRSDTGSFVLVHEPSQTVIVGDSLEATYARMQEHLRADPSLARATVDAPGAVTTRRWAWLVGIGVVALLPFLWLVVLHYTLGRLVEELRAAPATAPAAEVQTLRAELEALRQVVSRVEDRAGQARPSEPRVGRLGQARRPVELGVVVDEREGAEGPTDGESETGDGPGTDNGEESGGQ